MGRDDKFRDVFIAYARKDLQYAREISNILVSEGISTFLDMDDIPSGVVFSDYLASQIINSKVIVLLVSKNSMESRSTIAEICYAHNIGKEIIPIRIDDSPYEGTLGFMLMNLQYIEWNQDVDCARNQLIKGVSYHLAQYSYGEIVEDYTEAEKTAEIDRLDAYVPSKINTDIFISYRRVGGLGCARQLMLQLRILGYQNIFFDFDSLRDGKFNTQILDAIYSCNDFLLLLSPDAMDRCGEKGDWVAREIRTAIKYDKKIIPITIGDNFSWPSGFPKDMEPIKDIQFHKLLMDEYFPDSMNRLANRLITVSSAAQPASTVSEKQHYYKVVCNKKARLLIDGEEKAVLEPEELKKIQLPDGEYYVQIIDINNPSNKFKTVLCLEKDKVEEVEF